MVDAGDKKPKYPFCRERVKEMKKNKVLGIAESAEVVANQFMEELVGKCFIMQRSQNSGENYTKTRQKRDSQAVIAFAKTNTAQYIMKLS